MEITTRKLFWTNGSFTLILPKKWMKQLGIEYSSQVSLTLRDNEIIIILPNKDKETDNGRIQRPDTSVR